MASLAIRRGSSHRWMMRWAQPRLAYITGVTLNATAPFTITATAHGLPDGWLVAIQNATGGFASFNADSPPASSQYLRADVVDGTTLAVNRVNAVGFKPSQPATLVYRKPHDLTGCTARAQMRKKINSPDPVLAFTSELAGGIIIDTLMSATTLQFTEAQTRSVPAGSYVMDIELVMPDGSVLATSVIDVEVTDEVTHD